MHEISAKTDSLDVLDQICPKGAFQFGNGKVALVRPTMVVTFSARGPTDITAFECLFSLYSQRQ